MKSINGFHSITRENGNKEEGEFVNGKLNGIGKITGTSGTYEGTFRDGILNGQGLFINVNGNYQKGIFLNGKLNGQGKMIWATKNEKGELVIEEIVEGIFKDFKLITGSIIKKNGEVREGQFKNFELNGKGKLSYKHMHVTIFTNPLSIFKDIYVKEGIFKDDELIKGLVKTWNGSFEEGEFKNGTLHGKGLRSEGYGKYNSAEKSFPNKEIMEGTFKNGSLINGKITNTNGCSTNGKYINNLLNGNGEKILPDNSINRGVFQQDKLITGTIISPDGKITTIGGDIMADIKPVVYNAPTTKADEIKHACSKCMKEFNPENSEYIVYQCMNNHSFYYHHSCSKKIGEIVDCIDASCGHFMKTKILFENTIQKKILFEKKQPAQLAELAELVELVELAELAELVEPYEVFEPIQIHVPVPIQGNADNSSSNSQKKKKKKANLAIQKHREFMEKEKGGPPQCIQAVKTEIVGNLTDTTNPYLSDIATKLSVELDYNKVYEASSKQEVRVNKTDKKELKVSLATFNQLF